MKKIIPLMLLGVVLLLMFHVFSCAQKPMADIGETEVNIGSLRGPTTIGMIKMHHQKPFLGENVQSSYQIVQSPDLMVSKILSGEIDIAALPTNIAVQLYNRGVAYRFVSVIGYNVLYLLYHDNEITSWQDMINKNISVPARGTTPDVVLRYILEQYDLQPDTNVSLDYTANQIEISQLMIAGDLNIAILPEPFVTLVLNQNDQAGIAMDIGSEWEKIQDGMPLPMSCLVASKSFLTDHPEVMAVFLEEYEQSIDWVNHQPQEAAQLIEQFDLGMDAATAEQAIPRCNIQLTPSQEAKEIVNSYIQVLLDFSPEDVGGNIPDEDFYY